MSNRDARHTLQLLSKPSALHTVRDVTVYAPDMYGRPYGLSADPTAGITINDPYWSFADGAIQGICTIVKVPNDRVKGTDIKFYLEFGIPTGPGGGTIMWRLDWLVRGVNNLYNVVPTTRFLPTVSGAIYHITATAKLIIPTYDVDYQHALGQPLEFFLGIIRQGTHPDDTEISAAHLHKLVMEYSAYY
jgi:hypothetical protein